MRTQCAYHYVYQAGVCLLDLEDPTKVVAKAERAILVPKMGYELTGQTPSVVFPTAAMAEPDGSLKIYYGAADSVQCLAQADVSELIAVCKNG